MKDNPLKQDGPGSSSHRSRRPPSCSVLRQITEALPAPGCRSAAEPTSDPPCESRKEKKQRNLSHHGSVDQTGYPRPQTVPKMNTVWIFSANWKKTVWYLFTVMKTCCSYFEFCCYRCHFSSDLSSCIKQQPLRLFLGGKTSYSVLTTCHLTGVQPSFESQSVYKTRLLVCCREAHGMYKCVTLPHSTES